ncbi:zip zinc transporter [Paraphaeosphaeria sporulosa]
MSTCQSRKADVDYDLPLHIGALFIILGVSAGACAVPIIALRVPRLRIPANVHFGFRHFGTGVLIATAFVHLLPTAFVSLVDPCLPPFFNQDYPALAGAIALAAIFMITIAEMIFSPGRSLCSGPTSDNAHDLGAFSHSRRSSSTRTRLANDDGEAPASITLQFGRTRSGRSHSIMRQVERRIDASCADGDQPAPRAIEGLNDSVIPECRSINLQTGLDKKESKQHRKKLLMQCALLECGILFHSVFIGLALAVSTGSEQVILLIAIVFHQTFEGLALGSRIAAVGWRPNAVRPWIMALAYGCTTPLGQAIGIATRDLYDPNSATGLVIVGSFNAFSAGLLAYTSLVDLLSEDFLSEHSWRTLRGNRRIIAMSLVFFGAFCMALIGAWA